LGTISAPAQTLNSGDRKIGLEKVEITPFFGNEQQAFSMKSNAIASTPIRYTGAFYFRVKNIIIETGNAAEISKIFNHLN